MIKAMHDCCGFTSVFSEKSAKSNHLVVMMVAIIVMMMNRGSRFKYFQPQNVAMYAKINDQIKAQQNRGKGQNTGVSNLLRVARGVDTPRIMTIHTEHDVVNTPPQNHHNG